MRLSKKAFEELKQIYYSEFGKPLSEEAAQEMGYRLIRLFRIIYRPIPKENGDSIEQRGESWPQEALESGVIVYGTKRRRS